MKIAIGSDHAGFNLKNHLRDMLIAEGHEVEDVGAKSAESSDYPDFAEKVGQAVVGKTAQLGVLCCGTGVGISMAANKIHGIRAAMCLTKTLARYAREHNGANVLTLGSTLVSPDEAQGIVDTFLATATTEPRYLRRLGKLHRLEQTQ